MSYVDVNSEFDANQQEHYEKEKGYDSDQGLVDTITEGTVSIPSTAEYAAQQHYDEQNEVSQLVKEEQAFEAVNQRFAVRVNTNASRQVRFRTYTLTAAMGPIRILDDKDKRGDTVITVASGGPFSIGNDASVTAGGAATALVVGGRTVRTQDELWAVTGVTVTFDVQEEFD